MHKGHTGLLDVARKRAMQCGAQVALFTFDNNHLKVLGKNEKVLYTFEERLSIYARLNIDYIISKHFDEEFAAMTGEKFAELLCKYNLKGIVCGFDYSCGCNRLDAESLRKIMRNICPVDIVSAYLYNGAKIGTTLVRRMLEQHLLNEANLLLSQPFFITGTVTDGRGVGGKLGFPTANISTDPEKFLPVGVYGGIVNIDGTDRKCIVNIGNCPTFNVKDVTTEVHILDYSGNLYGKHIKVQLTKYLRPICKFDSAQSLVNQLLKDKAEVLND